MKITFKTTRRGLLYGKVKSAEFCGEVIPTDGKKETALKMAREIIAERKAVA